MTVFNWSIHDGLNCNQLFIASVGCYATAMYINGDAMRIVRWQIAEAWHLVLSHASLTFVITNCTVDKTMCIVSNGTRHNGSRAALSPSCSRSRNITFTCVPKRQLKWTQIGRCSWESIARWNDVPRGNNSEFGLAIVCNIGQLHRSATWDAHE